MLYFENNTNTSKRNSRTGTPSPLEIKDTEKYFRDFKLNIDLAFPSNYLTLQLKIKEHQEQSTLLSFTWKENEAENRVEDEIGAFFLHCI